MIAEASPVLPEMIRRALESRLNDLNVACPGTVVSFDPATQTATIQPVVRGLIPNDDGDLIGEDLPPIPNVPVLMFRTSTLSITSPMAKGDTVLLIFNTRAPTEWRTTGETGTPADARLHGIGYPVAIPGYLSNIATVPDTDDSIGRPGGLRIHWGDGVVNVGDGTLKVALADKVTAQLNTLKSAISGAVVVPNDGGLSLQTTILTALAAWPAAINSTNLAAD